MSNLDSMLGFFAGNLITNPQGGGVRIQSVQKEYDRADAPVAFDAMTILGRLSGSTFVEILEQAERDFFSSDVLAERRAFGALIGSFLASFCRPDHEIPKDEFRLQKRIAAQHR